MGQDDAPSGFVCNYNNSTAIGAFQGKKIRTIVMPQYIENAPILDDF